MIEKHVCEQKATKRYSSKETAKHGLANFLARMGFKNNYNYKADSCEHCGKFHVTVLMEANATQTMIETFLAAGYFVGIRKPDAEEG